MTNITFSEIEKDLKKRENFEEIKKAYLFAKEQHKDMKRQSGDDFITHPLEVCKILMGLNVDDTTLIASLIHETINHGSSSREEIERLFGSDVANIVESISKINK